MGVSVQQGQVTFRGMAPAQFRDEVVEIAAPEHDGARKLLAIWDTRPTDGLVVGRDIPSRAIASLLSHLIVWEPIDQEADFRARLAGDALHRRFDSDIKGRLMSELFSPADIEMHISLIRKVTRTGIPSVQRATLVCASVQQLRADVVILPVVPPDRVGVWAMSGAFYL